MQPKFSNLCYTSNIHFVWSFAQKKKKGKKENTKPDDASGQPTIAFH